ncbi:MAG: hypothetical protein FWD86_01960 [Firmicutes bacterium]|nr:hypothetical protein [Bacillota bacterium]
MIAIPIILIILIALTLPFRFKIKAGIDLNNGAGGIIIKLFKIPIYRMEFLIKIEEGKIISINRKNKKRRRFDADISGIKKFIKIIKRFNFDLIGNVGIKKIDIKADYGSLDAFNTVMVLGAVKIISYSVTAFLLSLQPFPISEQFTPHFDKKIALATAYGIFTLSIADIIYGLILSIYKGLKSKTKKTKKQTY